MDIKIGDRAVIKKRFSEKEVEFYGRISNDTNPIHLDKEYAKSTFFKKRIVHGILVGSLFGGLLGSELPGTGTIHLGQSLNFKKPVYIDEEIKAVIEVINVRKDKPIVTFKTVCYKSNGEIAIEGEAIVKLG